jgi:hypothetical protein
MPDHATGQSSIRLLTAECLPVTPALVRMHATRRSTAALANVARIDSHTSESAALALVHASLSLLGPPPAPASDTEAGLRALPEDRYEEYDQFFGAIRVQDRPVESFTRTLLDALRGHLTDALSSGLTMDRRESELLRAAFRSEFELLLEHSGYVTPEPDGLESALPAVDVVAADLDPLTRWRRGHQAFFALIQGLVVTIGFIHDGLRRSAPTEEIPWRAASDLMRGSAAALRYAGDFSRSDYISQVRPAMMPPHLHSKFSGLQLRDHRILLRRLAGLKSHIEATPDLDRYPYDEFLAALSETYDAHIGVCSRFGGDVEPSLRMPPGSSTPSIDVLQRFKDQRLRAAGSRPDSRPGGA